MYTYALKCICLGCMLHFCFLLFWALKAPFTSRFVAPSPVSAGIPWKRYSMVDHTFSVRYSKCIHSRNRLCLPYCSLWFHRVIRRDTLFTVFQRIWATEPQNEIWIAEWGLNCTLVYYISDMPAHGPLANH